MNNSAREGAIGLGGEEKEGCGGSWGPAGYLSSSLPQLAVSAGCLLIHCPPSLPPSFPRSHPPILAVFANYLYDTFGTSLQRAGALASVFGLVNLFSRPAGGWLSDAAARRCGAPGGGGREGWRVERACPGWVE